MLCLHSLFYSFVHSSFTIDLRVSYFLLACHIIIRCSLALPLNGPSRLLSNQYHVVRFHKSQGTLFWLVMRSGVNIAHWSSLLYIAKRFSTTETFTKLKGASSFLKNKIDSFEWGKREWGSGGGKA